MDDNNYLKELEKDNQAKTARTYAKLFLVTFCAIVGVFLLLMTLQNNQATFWQFASLVALVGPVWLYVLRD